MEKSQEWKDKISASLKKVVHTKEWNKKVSEGKKGISTKAWTYHTPKTPEHKRKILESYQRNKEERYRNFYIVDGELLHASNLCNPKTLKGTTIKEKLAKYTPATQEEIENWLKEHLVDAIFELECMKLAIR